jgi:hypothetical protein
VLDQRVGASEAHRALADREGVEEPASRFGAAPNAEGDHGPEAQHLAAGHLMPRVIHQSRIAHPLDLLVLGQLGREPPRRL